MLYELKPTNNQKSFYGKALVQLENGIETLYSYNTPIIARKNDTLYRLYNDFTATTGKHIKAFCGLNKKEFLAIPLTTLETVKEV